MKTADVMLSLDLPAEDSCCFLYSNFAKASALIGHFC